MDHCEYNLLNRKAVPIRHIEPRNGNAVISIMIEDATTMTAIATIDAETATTKISTSMTTTRTTTEEGTIDNTWNDRGTGNIDTSKEEDLFARRSVEKQPEITIGDQIQTRPLHNQSNERWTTTTG